MTSKLLVLDIGNVKHKTRNLYSIEGMATIWLSLEEGATQGCISTMYGDLLWILRWVTI